MTTSKEFMQQTTALTKFDQSLKLRGLTRQQFRVLTNAIWPGAEETSVLLAFDYCKSRGLDPFKKPVQIVPVWSGKLQKMVDGFWPGIAEIRITASRTNVYAGKDETVFGPEIVETFEYEEKGKKKTLTLKYPEWAQVTVYRVVAGVRSSFVGPKVIWKETYATASRNTDKPNYMWSKRPYGQLEKCSEAAALRTAFPEELGSVYSVEEMEGKAIDEETDFIEAETEVVEEEPETPDQPDDIPIESPGPPPPSPENQGQSDSHATPEGEETGGEATLGFEEEPTINEDQMTYINQRLRQKEWTDRKLKNALKRVGAEKMDQIPQSKRLDFLDWVEELPEKGA